MSLVDSMVVRAAAASPSALEHSVSALPFYFNINAQFNMAGNRLSGRASPRCA
ncbi:MAG: hypothetical protein ACYCT1_07375 [Steroidobacteraceae bacterium]|jgi:hypothetical protein